MLRFNTQLADTLALSLHCRIGRARFLSRPAFLAVILLAQAACGGDSSEDQVARARNFIESTNYTAASIELKNAIKNDSESAEARWLLGKIYLNSGDVLSGEKELLLAQKLGWNSNDVRPALARAQLAQGKFAPIREMTYDDLGLSAAAQLLSIKAQVELAEGSTQEARKLINSALEKDSTRTDVKITEARVLAAEGDLSNALLVIEKVIQQTPERQEAISLKGDILLRQQKLPEALVTFNKAIAISKNSFSDRFKRALVNLQLQDFDAARADVEILLEISPKHPASNYILGSLYFKDEKYPAAISALSLAEPAAQQFPMLLFYLGSAHLIEGNRDQAEYFANRLVTLEPNNVNGRKLLATIKLLQGKTVAVQELAQPLLDNNPNDVAALNLIANALLLEGKTGDGIALLEQVAKLRPDSAEAQARLGATLQKSGRSDEARELFEAALATNPKFQQADILLVLNLIQDNDLDGALKSAQAYRRRNPLSTTALNLLGKVYLINQQPEEARAAFKKALKINPGDPGAHDALAHMALAANDQVTARDHYESVLEHDPNSLSTLLKLAEMDSREQNDEAMVARLTQAVDAHPTNLEPRLLLGRYYLRAGKPEQVTPLFTTLSDLQKQSPKVLHLLAVAQLAADQHDYALITLERLVDYQPESAAYHHLLSMAAAGAGKGERARQELQTALSLDENYLPTLVTLARMSLIEQKPTDFDRYVKKLSDLAPNNPDVLRLRAIAAQRDDNSALAIELGLSAYAAKPSTQTMLELSEYYQAAGKTAAALELQEDWTQRHPRDVAARMRLASLLEIDNRGAESRLQYEAVLDLEPDNLIALNNLAWLLRLNERSQALKYISHASRLAPERPEILDTLALIEHLNGNNREARRHIERALANAPGHPSMLYHRAMIDVALGDTTAAIRTLQELLDDKNEDFSGRDEAEALLALLED